MLDASHQLKKKLFLGELSPKSNRKISGGFRVANDGSDDEAKSKRKSLPTLPSPEEEKSMSLSVAKQRTPPSPAQLKSYGPYFLEYTLMAEYNQLRSQRIPGVYVLPAAKSPLIWYAVIFIRMGSYQDGIFKLTMRIPENFPDGDCPSVEFKCPVYHPVVELETGELDVKRTFPKWRRNVNHIWQVLLYARRIFYKIDVKEPLNPEAAYLYENDRDQFKQKVNECLRKCHNEVHLPHDDDPHAIRFVELSSHQMDETKRQIIEAQSKPERVPTANARKSGLSWMKKGSNEMFSKKGS